MGDGHSFDGLMDSGFDGLGVQNSGTEHGALGEPDQRLHTQGP